MSNNHQTEDEIVKQKNPTKPATVYQEQTVYVTFPTNFCTIFVAIRTTRTR